MVGSVPCYPPLPPFLYSYLMERPDNTTYLGNSASHNCDDVAVDFVIGSVPQEVLVALFDSSDRHYENERGESGPCTYWTVWQYCLKYRHCSLICEIKPTVTLIYKQNVETTRKTPLHPT